MPLERLPGGFVRMPDGIVIEGVGEATDDQLYARWLRHHRKVGGEAKYNMRRKQLMDELASTTRPEPAAPVGPPDGLVPRPVQSAVEAFGSGVVQSGERLSEGILDLADRYAVPGDRTQSIAERAEKLRRSSTLYESLQADNPGMAALGNMAYYQAIPPARTFMGAVGSNAALAAAEYQDDPDERLKSGATAAGMTAVAHPLLRGIGRLVAGRPDKLTGREAELADWWLKHGGKLPPSALRANPQRASELQKWEAGLRKSWRGGGVMDEIDADNAKVLVRAITRELGEEADEITDAYLNSVNSRAKSLFSEALDGYASQPSPALFDAMDGALEQAKRNLVKVGPVKALTKQMRQVAADALEAGQPLTAEQWDRWHSQVVKRMQAANRTGDTSLAEAYGILADSLQAHLEYGLAPGRAEKLFEARRLWRVMEDVMPAMDGKGGLRPGTLHSRLSRRYKTPYAKGGDKGDYFEAVRAANWHRDRMPRTGYMDAGPAEPPYLQRIGAGGAAGGAVDAALGTGGLAATIGAGAGAASIPLTRALNRAAMSRFAESGVLGGLSPRASNALNTALRMPQRGILGTVPEVRRLMMDEEEDGR